jgi:hypothetical protein
MMPRTITIITAALTPYRSVRPLSVARASARRGTTERTTSTMPRATSAHHSRSRLGSAKGWMTAAASAARPM